jgi:hypothetical protein
MPTYNYLPGTIVNILDGGVTSQFAPTDDAILIIGTAGQGVCNTPFQVTDRSAAASEFGFSGSLERSIEECATYSDNIIAFRMGTAAMVLRGLGTDTTTGSATTGFDIVFSDVTADAGTRYKVWYSAGVLAVWKDNELQYSNQANAAVDTNDISVTAVGNPNVAAVPAGNAGLQLGTGTAPALTGAITVTAAAAMTGTTNQPAPKIATAPVDGTGLNGRQKYIALRKALDLLTGIRVKIVYCPDAVINQPNVAFYVASDPTTAVNNPATNPDALDWLLVTTDAYNDNVYQWASELTDSNGGVTTAMTAVSAEARQTAGFMEVNFGSTLGNFAANLSEIGPLVVAIIGTSAPVSTKLVDTRRWVGYLPTYATGVDGNTYPITDGSGLLGIPYLTGITSTKLNNLCADHVNGYRLPGLYVTEDGSYDGIIEQDPNGNNIDAGAHLHVVADWAFMSNGWSANYVQNIAGLVTGYLSALDPASGLTNKQVKATQIWQATPVQMDALTEAKINVLRYKGANALPALLHDLTAATNASDYTNLVRVRCMGIVIQTLLTRANNYIGQSSLDGLTLVAMKTQLDQDITNLTQRGYCNHSNVTISSTTAQQKIGHATLTLTVHPADELIQLTANVGVGQ